MEAEAARRAEAGGSGIDGVESRRDVIPAQAPDRGQSTGECERRGDDIAGYRNRDGWKLGDIIHSTPIVVGPPSPWEPSGS